MIGRVASIPGEAAAAGVVVNSLELLRARSFKITLIGIVSVIVLLVCPSNTR